MRTPLAIFAGIFMAIGAFAAPAMAWGVPDVQEEVAMRAENPAAADLIDKGSALAAAGSMKEAAALFRQAELAATRDPLALPWLRDCEASIALGDRQQAIAACGTAVQTKHNPVTIRALVSALVDGGPPTAPQLFQALAITERERRVTPWLPTAPAATCDIAMSIGDGIMLQRCTEDLVRIAPDDPMTHRALQRLALACPPWRFWTGWLAIVAVVAATIFDALARRFRLRPRRGAAFAAMAGVVLLATAGPARAEDQIPPGVDKETFEKAEKEVEARHLSKFMVDEKDPEAHVPNEEDRNRDPIEFGYWLQDAVAKGKLASRRGDHVAATRYFAALTRAVPDRATAFGLLCSEYDTMGETDKAIRACGEAIMRDGSVVNDYVHFVHLVIGKPGDLSTKEVLALDNVLTHMKGDPAAHDVVDSLECEVGVRTSNVAKLRECTTALARRSPEGADTISYEWALALATGSYGEATSILGRAKAAGISEDSIDRMQR